MGFRFNHFNFNVLDLQKSLDFYAKALGLTEARRVEREGFTLVYLTDGETPFTLELTCLHDRKERYDLGECTAKWAASATKTPTWAYIL